VRAREAVVRRTGVAAAWSSDRTRAVADALALVKLDGYEQRMPAKMRRAALKGVLSAKQSAGELRVVEGFALDEIKTRAFIEHLDAWDAQGKVLLVLAARDETVERSCANVREVRVILADSLNVVELLEADTVIFTRDALTRAQEVYA